ncbi:hypothetical protein ACFPT7_00010 [Acidicapsa dinghuensis]|uniref:Uncharacterized protein n=1 Tax=Acidicapsa dinghuensis TaxID=2218256 RepID=A0ABW1E8N3_9BACT|nr:hypothetical protein [Acidicapsa dinghuensis]
MPDETNSGMPLREGLARVADGVRGKLTDALQDAVLGATQDAAIDVLADRHGGSAHELKEALKMPWEQHRASNGDLPDGAKSSEELGIDDAAVTEEQVSAFEAMKKMIGDASE